jgi:hypothetical protein
VYFEGLEAFEENFGQRGAFQFLVLLFFFRLLAEVGLGEGVSDLLAEVFQVLRGNLEGVEDGAGGGTVHLAELKGMNHLHEGELEGGGVLDEGDLLDGERVIDEFVKAAEDVVAQGGLGTGLVVETDVLAARGGVGGLDSSGH